MPGIKGTMEEFKAGTLHSGSKEGPKVTNRKQAVAIGLSEERKAGKKVAKNPMKERKAKQKAEAKAEVHKFYGVRP